MGTKGEEVDLTGVVAGADEVDDRVPHGKTLARFAEAVVTGTDNELDQARAAVLEAVGGAGLVDAAAVIGNFERMVRVADASGIPLDETTVEATTELREELSLNAYKMADRTLNRDS